MDPESTLRSENPQWDPEQQDWYWEGQALQVPLNKDEFLLNFAYLEDDTIKRITRILRPDEFGPDAYPLSSVEDLYTLASGRQHASTQQTSNKAFQRRRPELPSWDHFSPCYVIYDGPAQDRIWKGECRNDIGSGQAWSKADYLSISPGTIAGNGFDDHATRIISPRAPAKSPWPIPRRFPPLVEQSLEPQQVSPPTMQNPGPRPVTGLRGGLTQSLPSSETETPVALAWAGYEDFAAYFRDAKEEYTVTPPTISEDLVDARRPPRQAHRSQRSLTRRLLGISAEGMAISQNEADYSSIRGSAKLADHGALPGLAPPRRHDDLGSPEGVRLHDDHRKGLEPRGCSQHKNFKDISDANCENSPFAIQEDNFAKVQGRHSSHSETVAWRQESQHGSVQQRDQRLSKQQEGSSQSVDTGPLLPSTQRRLSDEKSEDRFEQHPLFPNKAELLSVVLEKFEAYQTRPSGSDEKRSGGSLNQTSARSSENSRGKRKRSNQDIDDEEIEDSDDSSPRKNQKKPKICDEESGGRLTFACPFSKKDPVAHKSCYRYTLKRIRDVKQHLRRCHRRSAYCPVCGQIFKSETVRDSHVRQRICVEGPIPDIDGLTDDQRDRLSARCSSKMSEEAQWFATFEIMFPGHPHPSSPYIDPSLSEESQFMREFFVQEGPSILLERLEAHHVWNTQDQSFLLHLLEDGLEEIATRSIQAQSSNAQRRLTLPHQPTPSSQGQSDHSPSAKMSAPAAAKEPDQAPGHQNLMNATEQRPNATNRARVPSGSLEADDATAQRGTSFVDFPCFDFSQAEPSAPSALDEADWSQYFYSEQSQFNCGPYVFSARVGGASKVLYREAGFEVPATFAG